MHRFTSLAARRQLRGLATCAAGLRARKAGVSCSQKSAGTHRLWASVDVRPARPFSAEPGRRPCRRRFEFTGEKRRQFSCQSGAEEPPESSEPQPPVSVVGIPDPLTWIRCKVITYLTDMYFETEINSMEFDRGVKQALVHVSNTMSRGTYHELKGVVSNEMIEYVEKRCRSLTDMQRKQLAINMDDIIFVLPEDVSVVFDEFGRKFCFVVMRFWLLSSHEGPDDPEGTKIFRVNPSEDDGPKKKIATAVYEFHRELTRGACPDWTVTTVWHWHWKLAE